MTPTSIYMVGYIRLVVNKWGKLSPHPDGLASTPPAPEPSRVKREENKSAGTHVSKRLQRLDLHNGG